MLFAFFRQILFISVEQLSLNVADDSAKTLLVLGNMGGVLDDCRLKFVQKYRRLRQNTPDLGVQRIFPKSAPPAPAAALRKYNDAGRSK